MSLVIVATRLLCFALTLKKEGSPDNTAKPPTTSPGWAVKRCTSPVLSGGCWNTINEPIIKKIQQLFKL